MGLANPQTQFQLYIMTVATDIPILGAPFSLSPSGGDSEPPVTKSIDNLESRFCFDAIVGFSILKSKRLVSTFSSIQAILLSMSLSSNCWLGDSTTLAFTGSSTIVSGSNGASYHASRVKMLASSHSVLGKCPVLKFLPSIGVENHHPRYWQGASSLEC